AAATGGSELRRSAEAQTATQTLRPQRFDTKDKERGKRVEQALVPEPKVANAPREADAAPAKAELAVRTFASEIDPLELGMLDTGHLVLFRNVWRDGQRYIQGALLDRTAFLAGAIEEPYRASTVAGVADLAVVYQGRTLLALPARATQSYASTPRELAGTAVHRTRLSPPLGDLEIAFTLSAAPGGPT